MSFSTRPGPGPLYKRFQFYYVERMRLPVWIMALGLPLAGCASLPPTPPPPAYDPAADIEQFLATEDPAQESLLIEKLKQEGVSSEQVRDYLKSRSRPTGAGAGTFFNLTLRSQGREYAYSLRAPESRPDQTFPLVVILHGAGGSGQTTLPRWIERLPEHYVIACPSYPAGAWWARPAEDLVLDLIRHLQSHYPIDPNRVFLAGLSNGAVGAYMIGMFYPDYFAGIIPIAGTITERYMHFLVNLVHTPLYAIQGRHDPIFPIAYTERIRRILADLKYPTVFRIHEQRTAAHGGHFLPDAEVAPLVEWMDHQRRVVDPAQIRLVREGNHLDAVQWVRLARGVQLAALQIPGPEGEPLKVRDGKIATLIAQRLSGNEFALQGKNLLEFELRLHEDLIDYAKPVLVTYEAIEEENGRWITRSRRVVFEGRVKPDLEVVLRGFKQRRDPELIYETLLPISVEEPTQIASRP